MHHEEKSFTMDDLTDYFHANLVYVDDDARIKKTEEIKGEQYKIPTQEIRRD